MDSQRKTGQSEGLASGDVFNFFGLSKSACFGDIVFSRLLLANPRVGGACGVREACGSYPRGCFWTLMDGSLRAVLSPKATCL